RVDFYAGATLIGSDSSAPYSINWSNVGAGNYNLTAVAVDNQNSSTTSAVIAVSVTGNTAPTVNLTAPSAGASYTAPASITVSANAADSDGSIARVDFYAAGNLIGSDSSAPYSISWSNVAAGSYSVTAVAVDNLGVSTTSSAVSITVTAGSSNVPPTVSLSAPGAGASYTAPAGITVTANAADSDGSVARVDFYANGSLIGSDSSAPYSINWANVAAGSYSLTAVAVDNQNASTTSAAVAINVGVGSGGPVTVNLQDDGSSYTGTRDVYLSSWAKDGNYGSNTALQEGNEYRDLLRFAIFQSEGGPVPDGAVIQSATLSLYKTSYYDYVYRAHRLLKDWLETQATWNVARSGVPWATASAAGAGTDYVATADGQGSAGWNPGWMTIDVTVGVQSMAQASGT
ncbi:Ig-like domain-containing protein, partial [Chitinimonas naiadis]